MSVHFVVELLHTASTKPRFAMVSEIVPVEKTKPKTVVGVRMCKGCVGLEGGGLLLINRKFNHDVLHLFNRNR